ncbi:uncharacterized protein LOC141609400 [Silene latifolia]|uniref:uncharacterized protein LOC141609400 n=1 Tax=Silene latifolia TaxID=37657 RepID=UPI003D7702F2
MTINSYDDDDDDNDDVSSTSSTDSLEYRLRFLARKMRISGEEETKEMIEAKRKLAEEESDRKINEWLENTNHFRGLLDTSNASLLKLDGHKLKLSKPMFFDRLASVLWLCRNEWILSYFTHPGGDTCDDGLSAIENSPTLSEKNKKRYSSKSRLAIKQYNKIINDKQSKLEFYSFVMAAFTCGCQSYITFTAACQNGQLGTYQALLVDGWYGDPVYLVLLRHLEADKIIAIMSLSGTEEEWEKLYGKKWKLLGRYVGL